MLKPQLMTIHAVETWKGKEGDCNTLHLVAPDGKVYRAYIPANPDIAVGYSVNATPGKGKYSGLAFLEK